MLNRPKYGLGRLRMWGCSQRKFRIVGERQASYHMQMLRLLSSLQSAVIWWQSWPRFSQDLLKWRCNTRHHGSWRIARPGLWESLDLECDNSNYQLFWQADSKLLYWVLHFITKDLLDFSNSARRPSLYVCTTYLRKLVSRLGYSSKPKWCLFWRRPTRLVQLLSERLSISFWLQLGPRDVDSEKHDTRISLSPQCHSDGKPGVIVVTATRDNAWYAKHFGAYFLAVLYVAHLSSNHDIGLLSWYNTLVTCYITPL